MLQCNKQNADALFQAGRLRLMVFMPEEGIQAMTKYLGSSEHKSGGWFATSHLHYFIFKRMCGVCLNKDLSVHFLKGKCTISIQGIPNQNHVDDLLNASFKAAGGWN